MTHPHAGQLFHTGMVVDHLEPAMDSIGSALGLSWAEPASVSSQVWVQGQMAQRDSLVTISIEGPHHIELIELGLASPEDQIMGGVRMHHVGLWTRDLAAEVSRLEGLGFRSELAGTKDGEHPFSYSYHYNHHGGLWIEILSKELFDGLESYLAGGDLTTE